MIKHQSNAPASQHSKHRQRKLVSTSMSISESYNTSEGGAKFNKVRQSAPSFQSYTNQGQE